VKKSRTISNRRSANASRISGLARRAYFFTHLQSSYVRDVNVARSMIVTRRRGQRARDFFRAWTPCPVSYDRVENLAVLRCDDISPTYDITVDQDLEGSLSLTRRGRGREKGSRRTSSKIRRSYDEITDAEWNAPAAVTYSVTRSSPLPLPVSRVSSFVSIPHNTRASPSRLLFL